MKPILSLNGISHHYNGNIVLDQVSFDMHAGKITTLIGPNGAGKTTLVKILLGLLSPSQGTIHKANGVTIGYMPQKIAVDATLPLSAMRFVQLSGASTQACRDAMTLTGVSHLQDAPVQGLSGGELQRLLLARAIVRKPHFLVLDEPVQGVDVNGQSALYQLINTIRQQINCAVLMVSHDLHLVMSATDEVICLNQHICCHGNPTQVTNDPEFIRLFGKSTAIYTHDHNHKHDLHGDVICNGEHHG